MPGRHSPPPVVDKPATEKIKRPKKTGTTNERVTDIQHALFEEIDSHPGRKGHAQSSTRAEALNTSAAPPPPADPSPVVASLPDSTGTAQVTEAAETKNDTAGDLPARPGITRVAGIDFHHESEAEFASLLNYYGIEWLYEPHQFPLQWRDDRPVEMFAPDFYLVEYDFYIELTTMRQSLVRKKNRKLRLLRALYPEINIKLLYRRDYQRILQRFGIRPGEDAAEPAPPDAVA